MNHGDRPNFSGPLRTISVVRGVLAIVNMVPVVGVIIWGWSVFEIVALYWAENLIIGALNIPRLLLARGGPEESKASFAAKGFLALFFAVHYGIFCTVHGFFVFFLLGESDTSDSSFVMLPKMLGEVAGTTGGAFSFLLLSHLFSFSWNYIGQREYRTTHAATQMFQPYGRIVILHIAILFGAFAIEMLGAPMILLFILIAGKTALDLGFHFFAHATVTDSEKEKTRAKFLGT